MAAGLGAWMVRKWETKNVYSGGLWLTTVTPCLSIGIIKAIQLDYSEAHKNLLQAIRKAPQHSGYGFKQTVSIFHKQTCCALCVSWKSFCYIVCSQCLSVSIASYLYT